MKTAVFSSNKTFGGRNISKKKNLFGKASLLKVLNLYFHSVSYNNIFKYIDYNIQFIECLSLLCLNLKDSRLKNI